MAHFFWLPYYDKSWFNYLNNGTGVNPNAKVLPFMGGGYGNLTLHRLPGLWPELRDDDHLQIATHGRKYTTDNVGWVDKDGKMMLWTPDDMASNFHFYLGSKRIHYKLLACFGANSWGLAASFGEKLLVAMKKMNLKGSLSALKGATNIGPGQGRQTGTGRFTAGIKLLKIEMPAALGGNVLKKGETDKDGVNSSAVTVTWDL
jgi:hypothetical protein